MPVFVVNEGFGGLPGGKPGTGTPIPGVTGTPEGIPKGGKFGWIKGVGSTIAAVAPVLPAAGAIGADSAGTPATAEQWAKLEADAKAKDLAELAQAGRDVDRVFSSTSPTVDGFAMSMSGLGSDVGEKLTPRMADARAEAQKFGVNLDGLPRKLVTEFEAPGLIKSREDAVALARQYNLTPKQKQTLFNALGIPQAKGETASLLEMYNKARGPIVGTVSVNTSAAEAALNRVLNLMNAVNRRGNIPSAPGVLPGESGRTSGRTPVGGGGGSGRRPAQINIHLDGQRIASVVDERITTHDDLADERRRAGATR
jgi:hypothetical protein